jgi:hypothetical protein
VVAGIVDGTGQNAGIEMRVRKSPSGRTSVMERTFPRATIPEMCAAVRERYARSPTMSETRLGPGEKRIAGESSRSIERLNVAAVTGSFDGGEKRKPDRTRNM